MASNHLIRLFDDNLRSLKWTSGVKGRVGYIRLSRDRVLIGKLELTNLDMGTPTSGKFVGYRCSVISVKQGVIDTTLFPFNDHLHPELREDNRPDYKDKRPFHCNRDMEWYIALPAFKQLDRYVRKIKEYFCVFEQG